MEQRTCNIIMCCKGHCKLAGENAPPLEAIAAYMSVLVRRKTTPES